MGNNLQEIYYDIFDSPIGTILVASTRLGLCLISINIEGRVGAFRELSLWTNYKPARYIKGHSDIKGALKRYLNGERIDFNINIDTSTLGATDFQRRVWMGLCTIPYGETRSYKWLAERVGCPNGFRAVGQANGKNPLPIIIPCHRVINSNGSIGGYSGGVEIKKRLLAIEGIKIK